MGKPEEFLGTTTFLKQVGITAGRMRLLEAAGVIKPLKADSGRRTFTRRDVEAARAHMAARPANRYAPKHG